MEHGYRFIEGTAMQSLTEVPSELFAHMSQLTFLHFGVHPRLRSLPSWDGLGNLKSLTLVMLMSLKELPPFDGVPNLERFLLAVVPLIDSVPDMTPLRHLKAFFTIDRGTMCCNGFLDNVCNLAHSMCVVHPMWKTPAATCLPANRTATPGTLAFFRAFSSSVCADQAVRPGAMPSPPSEVNMRECNGTLFRQCTVPVSNLTGLCYNSKMNAIHRVQREPVRDGHAPPPDRGWGGRPVRPGRGSVARLQVTGWGSPPLCAAAGSVDVALNR